jgi:hypothetical protein
LEQVEHLLKSEAIEFVLHFLQILVALESLGLAHLDALEARLIQLVLEELKNVCRTRNFNFFVDSEHDLQNESLFPHQTSVDVPLAACEASEGVQ